MNLYEVTNGYIGDSYVRAVVIAETPERAKNLAEPSFKEEAHYEVLGKKKCNYPESYWEDLHAHLLIEDVSKEQCFFQGD